MLQKSRRRTKRCTPCTGLKPAQIRFLSLLFLTALFLANIPMGGNAQTDCDFVPPIVLPSEVTIDPEPCSFWSGGPAVGGQCDPVNPGNFVVRVAAHVLVRESDKLGAQSFPVINESLDIMVREYAGHGITFSFEKMDTLSVSDSLYYYENGEYFELIDIGGQSDRIDIYFCGPGIYNNGKAIPLGSGNTLIERTAAVIGGGTSSFCEEPPLLPSIIVAHEVGHLLGLDHTDNGNINSPNAPSGFCANFPNDCQCGDHVADTQGIYPADTTSVMACLRSNCGCDSTACDTDGTLVNNIMTVSTPGHCRMYFSEGQVRRMKRFLTECPTLYNLVEEDRIKIAEGIDITYDSAFAQCLPAIEIENGGHLTIKTDIDFEQGKGILIKEGGRLTVNSSTLKGCSGNYWAGIEVFGNSSKIQWPATFQGFVTLSNSTVEKAEKALLVDGGGLVWASSTDFDNCGPADFRPYPKHSTSFFKDCNFTTDSGYGLGDVEANIKLFGLNGMTVDGCSFTESGNGNFARAIVSKGADLVVKNTCYFEGYFTGIHASEFVVFPFARLQVYDSDFVNNKIGVANWSLDNTVVKNNTFEINGLSSFLGGRGMELRNCTGYKVLDNTFTGITSGSFLPKTIGILAYNTGGESNVLQKNTYSGFHVANQAELSNQDPFNPNEGLQYWCNDNLSPSGHDFYIWDEGISISQGIGQATLNKFTHFNSNLGDFNNQAVGGNVQYFHDDAFEETPQTGYYFGISPNVSLTFVTCNEDGDSKNLTVSEEQTLVTEFNIAHGNYLTKKQAYEALPPNSGQLVILGQQMAASKDTMHRVANRILRSELADTTGLDLVKYRTWLSNKESIEAAYETVETYVSELDTVNARLVRDSIPWNYDLSTTQTNEHSLYVQWSELEIGMLQNGSDPLALDPATVAQVQNIADNSVGLSGSQSQGLLNYAYNYSYQLYPKEPGGSGGQGLMAPLTGSGTFLDREYIRAYPNPAKEAVTFEYGLPDETSFAQIELTDINGKAVESFVVEGRNGKIAVNVGKLPVGIYLYQLKYEGSTNKVFKLTVTR